MKKTLLLLILLVSLNGLSQSPRERYAFAVNNQAVGCDIYRTVSADNSNSVLISPFSLTATLGLLAETADSTSRNAINTYLTRKGKWNLRTLPALGRRLMSKNEGVNTFSMYAVWPNNHIKVNNDFKSVFSSKYKGKLTSLNFNNLTDACQTINDWGDTHTKGMIKQVVTPKDFGRTKPSAIINHLTYFEGYWSKPFDEDSLVANFTRVDDSITTLTFLHKTEIVRYSEQAGYKAIGIPYGFGNSSDYQRPPSYDYTMWLVLPDNNESFHSIEKFFSDPIYMKSFIGQNLRGDPAITQEVAIRLPKFKQSCKFSILEDLEGLILKQQSKNVVLNGLLTNKRGKPLNTELDFIYHNTAIEITRARTRAAAITTGSVSRGGPSKQFYANHPFLYTIVHNPTGTVLFMGRYMGNKNE